MSQTEIQEEKNNFENKLFNKTEPKKFIRKKKTNIIEFEKNPKQENKINSPRSKEAITNLGYIFDELIYLDYNKFKQEHPEIIPLDPEIQQKRYIFFENQRKNKIEEIKELYERICIDEEKRKNFSRTMVNNYLDKKNNENEEITFIKNKELEIMKSKSEIEFINMINNEIKREIMEEESKRKFRLQNEKRELIKQEIIKKREIELKNKLQREKVRKEKEEEERERIKLKEKEKYEEEIKKRKEEEEKKKKK